MMTLPNAITLGRIALVVVFTIAVSLTPDIPWGYPLALIAFCVAAASDWLDGYLARKLHEVTTFGKLIDPLADKIAVAAAIIYLVHASYCPVWVAILIVMREFLITGLRQIAQEHHVIMAADYTGKWKTTFQLAFCIGCLLDLTVKAYPNSLGWCTPLTRLLDPQSDLPILYHITLWGSIILTAWSGGSYCFSARKFLFR